MLTIYMVEQGVSQSLLNWDCFYDWYKYMLKNSGKMKAQCISEWYIYELRFDFLVSIFGTYTFSIYMPQIKIWYLYVITEQSSECMSPVLEDQWNKIATTFGFLTNPRVDETISLKFSYTTQLYYRCCYMVAYSAKRYQASHVSNCTLFLRHKYFFIVLLCLVNFIFQKEWTFILQIVSEYLRYPSYRIGPIHTL